MKKYATLFTGLIGVLLIGTWPMAAEPVVATVNAAIMRKNNLPAYQSVYSKRSGITEKLPLYTIVVGCYPICNGQEAAIAGATPTLNCRQTAC